MSCNHSTAAEIRKGQVMALLMQGQSQQHVAMHFSVNVSTIDKPVRRLGYRRAARRPRPGRSCVTFRRQDMPIYVITTLLPLKPLLTR